jgi:dihydroxy-acid dehydratase
LWAVAWAVQALRAIQLESLDSESPTGKEPLCHPMNAGPQGVLEGLARVPRGAFLNSTGPNDPIGQSSMELVTRQHAIQAVVAVAGGDETLPGVLMAMARLNIPSVLVYAGVTRSKFVSDEPRATGRDAVPALTRVLSADASDSMEQPCYPSGAVCPRQRTAGTMALIVEALGVTPLGLGGTENTERLSGARCTGELLPTLLKEGRPLPRDLITRKRLENACAAVAATGGSTNAALHLPAIAHEAGLKFTVDDVAAVFRRTLVNAQLHAGGRDLISDLYQVGGVPAILAKLLASGALHGDVLTIHGTELEAALAWGPAIPESRRACAP